MSEKQSQVHPVVAFKRDLQTLIERKELSLPSNVSVDAFRNAAIVAVQDNPEILRCEPASVMKALRTVSAAGLVPDGREAAIVPFKGQAQAMPMVFGLIKMARRSGDVKDIRAHIVYQNELDQDRFEYVVGDEETLRHEPILFGNKGPAVAAYAIAKLKDGTIVREFMDKDQIEKVRKSSPQQRGKENPSGIWQTWTDEMWKKSVIRRLCKRLDLSAEDLRRVMVDEDTPPMRDVTPTEQQEPQNLANRIQFTEEKTETEEQGEPITGEIMDDGHWTDEIDTTEAFPGDDAWDEGVKAAKAGTERHACPHKDHTVAIHWLGGFDAETKRAAEEKEDA